LHIYRGILLFLLLLSLPRQVRTVITRLQGPTKVRSFHLFRLVFTARRYA